MSIRTSRGLVVAATVAAGVMVSTQSAGARPAAADATGRNADTNPAISYSTVFSRDQDGYNSFRIPSIVRTDDGTLLAFAEGRVDSPSDNGNIDVVLKRSVNGGKTWGPLQVVDDNNDDKSGNPVPVVDRRTGRIILNTTHTGGHETLQTITCGQATVQDTRRPFIQYSDDDGRTWSTPRDITDEAKLPTWRHFVGGPGHGIQLQHGSHAGRLVIAGDHSITPPAGMDCTDPGVFGGQAIYSDDGGTSWHVGGVDDASVTHPNESTAAELPDGTVYFNTRTGSTALVGRADTTSHDGGTSFDHSYRPVHDVVAAQVSCSVLAMGDRLVLSAPNHATSRERMTLWSSTDRGRTWRQGPLVYAGPSSYSDLVQLGARDRSIGVLYENGDRVPTDTRVTYGQRITFARVPTGLLNSPPPAPARTPDVGPGHHDAVVSGAPQPVGGRFGGALHLAGDYVEVPRTPELLFGHKPFSVAAWFRTSSTRKQTVVWANGTGNQPQWSVQLLANQTLRATINGDNVNAAGDYADGAWHQVVLTRGTNAVSLYIDGTLAARGAAVQGSVSDDSVGGIRFGARLDGINDPLLGDLDDSWLADQALTADQVQRSYLDNTMPPDATVLHMPMERIHR